MPCPLPRRTRRVRLSVASPSARPSPFLRRVGVRDFTFEACSGFTHVTACRIARSPEATFVTRLRPGGLPGQAARQLPAQPTTRWVEPSSTGGSRLRGAPEIADIAAAPLQSDCHAKSAVRTTPPSGLCLGKREGLTPVREARPTVASITNRPSGGRRHVPKAAVSRCSNQVSRIGLLNNLVRAPQNR